MLPLASRAKVPFSAFLSPRAVISPASSPSPPSRPGSGGSIQADPGLAALLSLEWLETDGCGGYAASTPLLCPTRRQHGLLVAPFPGTSRRHVFLSRFDEVLSGPGAERDALSVARYGQGHAPRGDRALESFELAPHPSATFRLGQARLQREVRMVRGRHAVLVRYLLEASSGPRILELRPFLPFREADALTIENETLDPGAGEIPRGIRCRPYRELPALALTASEACPFQADPVWARDMVFEADRARGYLGSEDQFSPGLLLLHLEPGEDLILAASIDAPVGEPRKAWERATTGGSAARSPRRAATGGAAARSPRARTEPSDSLGLRLDRAANCFLYRAPGGRLGVIAGFPWFLEWGRDTFLSLPGLTLSRGRTEECAEVLQGAVPFLRDGLLPNVFGADPEDSHYGSADAALWFARAALLYRRAGGSEALVRRELLPALESMAEAYLAGTGLGLRVDEAGMLHAGSPELNPTWMDAQTAAGPVTPRHGCPVEIAALWCSLLAQLEELSMKPGAARHWQARRRAAQRAFRARFWDEERAMLVDVWREDHRDQSVRPNMVLAAALEHAPLTKSQRQAVVRTAERELLTPRGLRTLSPSDPAYRGRYRGGPEERDAAYHQGTVWPWLLGFYVEASLRAFRPTKARLAALQQLVDGLAPELDRAGWGHVSEVFDGDEPHEPGGCFAQAWNTAEWLRARHLLAEGRA